MFKSGEEATAAAVCIRRLQPADALKVATLHVDAFPGFFLSLLGIPFLRQFYLGLSTDTHGLAFVAESKGAILGFVAGSLRPSGSYRRLFVSRLAGFAFFAGLAVLRRPTIAPRLLRSVASRTTGEASAGTTELMSIAVDPGAQGRSIGGSLIAYFLREAARANAEQVILTTDADDNGRVNSFYRQHGFRLSRSFRTAEGRLMNEYAIDFDSPVRDAAVCQNATTPL